MKVIPSVKVKVTGAKEHEIPYSRNVKLQWEISRRQNSEVCVQLGVFIGGRSSKADHTQSRVVCLRLEGSLVLLLLCDYVS